MTGRGDDVHYRGDEVEGDDTVESIILVFRFFHLVLHFLKTGICLDSLFSERQIVEVSLSVWGLTVE